MTAIDKCARRFAETHPNDVARVLELSPAEDGASFLGTLSVDTAAPLLSQMSIVSGAEILSLMELEPAAALTSQLSYVSAVSLLRKLSPDKRSGVMAALPRESKERLESLLEFPDGTVGAVTDPEVLTIPDSFTIDEAQRLFRKRAGVFHHQLYVVDSGRRLVGFLHVRELLRASGKDSVTNIMAPATVSLPADTRFASTLHHKAWTQLDAIPVVDEAGVLLGIVRHRQLRRLQSHQQPGGAAGTIIGLSELYWIGLANFLRGGVGQVEISHGAPDTSVGGEHVA